jgi:hypothetical protein
VDCNDGDACTTDACAAGLCEHTLIPGCGDACAEPGGCDDGNACTIDECVGGGCEHTLSTAACDDGDPCTVGDTCAGGLCLPGAPSAEPACADDPDACNPMLPASDPVVCALSGSVGSALTCSLELASATQDLPLATGLQFKVTYDPTKLALVSITDMVCFGPAGCFVLPLAGPGSSATESGHSVSTNPGDPASATGQIGVVIINLGSPDVPINGAQYDGAVINGDPGLFDLNFEAIAEIPAGAPALVRILDAVAADENPFTLDAGVNDCGVLVTGLATVAMPLCHLSGAVGEQVDCPLQLARSAESDPPAAAVQFKLEWDPDRLAFVGMFDVVCVGPGGTPPCFDQSLPPATLFPSGHSVTLSAKAGSVAAIVINTGTPEAPITKAYLDEDGAVLKDPLFLNARFEILAPATPVDPTSVHATKALASTASATPMDVTISDGVFIASP